jgi:hypothetical protein
MNSIFEKYTTPGFRVNIPNRLGERPAMTAEVLRSVLPFAKGIIRWRMNDSSSGSFGAFTVIVNILYVHEDRRDPWFFTLYGDDGSFTKGELTTVIPDAESFFESKGLAQPRRGYANIVVGKFWNNHAWWHRTIPDHHSSCKLLILGSR